MKSLYLECKSGISGDMAVAALLDLGADKAVLQKVLDSMPLEGFKTEISRVQKSGIDVCDFNVILEHDNHDHDMTYLFGNSSSCHEHAHEHEHSHEHEGHHHHEHGHHHEHDAQFCEEHCHDYGDEAHTHEHHHEEHHHEHGEHHHHEHRGLAEIQKIIAGTDMTEKARQLALKIFDILAEAESKAHNKPKNEVHFHEVGAVDSIVDIVALAVCFDNLGIDNVIVPEMCEGTGTVRCQHGVLPVPVPAVSNIAAAYKLPLSFVKDRGEFITPTGAAFAAAVMTSQKLPGKFTVQKIGMGAGKRAYERPNFLRIFIIENAAANDEPQTEDLYKLETNIDDCSGEALGFAMERLLQAGALDVHYIPCFMKKNRPGWLLIVLCTGGNIARLEQIIFAETTTIGIRRIKVERTKLERREIVLKTEFGEIKAKQVTLSDGTTRNYPEYESVASICREKGLNFQQVYNKAAAL